MGGRFGKYGDAKRKAQIRKSRLRPPALQQRTKHKPLKGSRKSKLPRRVRRGGSLKERNLNILWTSPTSIDDLAGRKCAAFLHISLRGTLGIILAAKKRGIIPQARPVIETLIRSGLYLSKPVIDEALKRVNG